MDQNKLVTVETQRNGIAIVTLNRPQKRNALSAALIANLNNALETLDQDDSVRVIVVTGSTGGPFSGKYKILLF